MKTYVEWHTNWPFPQHYFFELGLNLFSVNALNDSLLIVSHVFKYGVWVMRGTLVKKSKKYVSKNIECNILIVG